MDKEKKLIEVINSCMPIAHSKGNRLFESDAEVIKFKNEPMLFTIDDFSEEDFFQDHDPYALGWNCAVGAISDIFASGGKPMLYAHSTVMAEHWNEEYVKKFSQGIAEVLRRCNTEFMGGDLGIGKTWRYTASVIGSIERTPLLRSTALQGEAIYITGPIGTGNVEAVLKLYASALKDTRRARAPHRFHLRIKEAELIRKYASSCIDTSDGVFNALATLSEMSALGYILTHLPYSDAGVRISEMLSLTKILLFLAEAGEYELLFTVSPHNETHLREEAMEQGVSFIKIGETHDPYIKILYDEGNKIDLSACTIRARDYPTAELYLKDLIKWAEKLIGEY